MSIGRRIYCSTLPRFYADLPKLREAALGLRAKREYHPLVEQQIAYVASRLSDPLHTVREIHALAGVRNDALSVSPTREILWEVFGTADRVDEDLRKLECDEQSNRLKLAIVLDQEIDPEVFEKFTRKRQSSGDRIKWLRVSDLLLASRVDAAVLAIQHWLDALRPRWSDELELVGFDLYGEHRHWYRVDWLPLCFCGLRDRQMYDDLEDPTFYVDVRNIGDREARVDAVYLNVRHRQMELHGIPGDQTLKPAAQVRIPLAWGIEGYREARLTDPVIVKPGEHARVLVGLDDAGYSWVGEVEIGLRYGQERRVIIPAISVLL